MKKKRSLIRLILFTCLLLVSFTNGIAQNVTVGINVYPGLHHWYITFNDNNGGYYEFETSDETLDTHILGTIPAGTYTVDFYSDYWWPADRDFEYGILGPTYYTWEWAENYYTWYNAVIEEGTWIQIDPR